MEIAPKTHARATPETLLYFWQFSELSSESVGELTHYIRENHPGALPDFDFSNYETDLQALDAILVVTGVRCYFSTKAALSHPPPNGMVDLGHRLEEIQKTLDKLLKRLSD